MATAAAEASISMMEEGGVEANCDREEDEEGGFDPKFFQEWMEELRGGVVAPNWSAPSEAGH